MCLWSLDSHNSNGLPIQAAVDVKKFAKILQSVVASELGRSVEQVICCESLQVLLPASLIGPMASAVAGGYPMNCSPTRWLLQV